MTLSRTSRVLFVLAAAAVAAFALLELPRRRAAEREMDHARRLFPPFAASVDRVEIVRPGARVLLEARGTRWEVVEPVHDAAEYSRVATLLDALARAYVERNLGPTDDDARFGLSPPVAVVTVSAAGDTLAYLELGAHTVDGAFAYARRDDRDIVLVPPALVSAAALPTDAFRDQNLVRFDPGEVEAFTVRRDGEAPVRWTRHRADAWFTVVAGDTVAGDSVEVPAHLRRFRGMRVRAFVDPADTLGAFAHASGSVTFHKRAPAPAVTIRFAARSDSSYWARTDGESRVIDVHGDVASALDASPARLRDRRLLQFDPRRARRIQVVTPDTSAVLVRAGDAWALPNPALGRIDPDAATDFVRALRTLRYRSVVDGTPNDLEPPAFTLVIAGDGDTILDELRGRPRAGEAAAWIVTSRSSRAISELAADDVEALADRLRRLRVAPRR
ncbi:MAG TPA: DUF4340 domain-containing protein [Candidatus Krumholzibacteria bacterium]|nr:DUF4340 domain-containing protein [Candidatus Krumholzibacteria bacterium]